MRVLLFDMFTLTLSAVVIPVMSLCRSFLFYNRLIFFLDWFLGSLLLSLHLVILFFRCSMFGLLLRFWLLK